MVLIDKMPFQRGILDQLPSVLQEQLLHLVGDVDQIGEPLLNTLRRIRLKEEGRMGMARTFKNRWEEWDGKVSWSSVSTPAQSSTEKCVFALTL